MISSDILIGVDCDLALLIHRIVIRERHVRSLEKVLVTNLNTISLSGCILHASRHPCTAFMVHIGGCPRDGKGPKRGKWEDAYSWKMGQCKWNKSDITVRPIFEENKVASPLSLTNIRTIHHEIEFHEKKNNKDKLMANQTRVKNCPKSYPSLIRSLTGSKIIHGSKMFFSLKKTLTRAKYIAQWHEFGFQRK